MQKQLMVLGIKHHNRKGEGMISGREKPMTEKELRKIKLTENVVCIRTKWCIEFNVRDWKGYIF